MIWPADTPHDRETQLHAHDSDQVYQAAGNQYIFSQQLAAATPNVVSSLPRDTAAFTGRDEEIHRLFRAIEDGLQDPAAMPIHAIDGMPGSGKTALAIHVGHLVKQHFPDGQVFIDLHAHTEGQAPVDPLVALEALLSADGIPPDRIPAGLDARTALWRGRIAQRRMLIIMDDAASYAQVEPLLPGADRSLVIITSRRRLTGLSIRYAPRTLSLDTLLEKDAVALFVRLAGHDPAPDEHEDVAKLVRLCGLLPLTICLLAAKSAAEPRWSAADLVSDLLATQDRLADLYAEDVALPAMAVDLSYRNLPTARQHLFRRLGLHPGADFEAYAVAALAGIGLPDARRHLDSLYGDHLLDQPAHGRYRMHEMVRDYARRLAREDPVDESDRAVARLLAYYEYVSRAAGRQLAARAPTGGIPHPEAMPDVSTPDRALAWTRAEIANLLAALAHANSRNLLPHVVALAAGLAPFIGLTGPWHQAIAMHNTAVQAAEATGDEPGRANALWNLGLHLRRAGDYRGAYRAFDAALAIYRDLQERLREADVLRELGNVYRMTGDLPAADEALRSALVIYRGNGDSAGAAAALTELGQVLWLTDRYAESTGYLMEALAIFRELGDRHGQAGALFKLGVVRRLTDDYAGAERALRQALAGYVDVGDRLGQANATHNLGTVHRQAGDYASAVPTLREGLGMYRELGDRLGEANALKQLAIVYRHTEDFPRSVEALGEAYTIYRDLGDGFGQADVLRNLGLVRRLTGDLPEAAHDLGRAMLLYRRLGNRLGQAKVANHIGALALQYGDVDGAVKQYELAGEIAAAAHSPSEEAHALEGLAWCCLQRGDQAGAVARLHHALEIYQRIGAPEAARTAAQLEALG